MLQFTGSYDLLKLDLYINADVKMCAGTSVRARHTPVNAMHLDRLMSCPHNLPAHFFTSAFMYKSSLIDNLTYFVFNGEYKVK